MNPVNDTYNYGRGGNEIINNSNNSNRIKLVVVGDSVVGKTSMLFAYTKNQFLANYQSTIFDNYAITINMDQKKYTINVFDTAGQEGYSHLRILSYPQTSVFLLCFSMVDCKSLESCRNIWMPEIRRYAGMNAPVLLIGTKEDLVDAPQYNSQQVNLKTAQRTANEIGCEKFLVCSSLTHRGLKRVFDEAILCATNATIRSSVGHQYPTFGGAKSNERGLLKCCLPM